MARCFAPRGKVGRFCGLLLLTGILFPFSPTLGEAEKEKGTVLVIGSAPLLRGNIAKAKTQAISKAMRLGVERYMVEHLGSEGMINNFHRVVYEVLPKAGELIENFNVLAEDQSEGEYKILVRIKINEKVMNERLKKIGLVIMEGPPIKILFMVSQILVERDEVLYWWNDPQASSGLTPVELALHRVFQERGFIPINRLLYFPEGDYSDEMKIFELSDEEVIKWGRIYSADVVLYGKCFVSVGSSVSVELKALGVKSGAVLAEGVRTEHMGENVKDMENLIGVIEKAVHGVAALLVPAIVKGTVTEKPAPIKLEIVLSGFKSFRQVKEIMEFLRSDVEGVQSVRQTRIRGRSIFLSIDFLGEEASFLWKVSRTKDLSFEMAVERTEEGTILFNIGEQQ
ncbi:MAG: hypothetical protein JRJ29_10380 [Deltaproteobacteria bacterium]|nr:hypothetical protein [Deltaproteobacteria bacterium]